MKCDDRFVKIRAGLDLAAACRQQVVLTLCHEKKGRGPVAKLALLAGVQLFGRRPGVRGRGKSGLRGPQGLKSVSHVGFDHLFLQLALILNTVRFGQFCSEIASEAEVSLDCADRRA